MRLRYFFVIVTAQARQPKHCQKGKLVRMESAECRMDEKNGKILASEMIGTGSSHMKTPRATLPGVRARYREGYLPDPTRG